MAVATSSLTFDDTKSVNQSSILISTITANGGGGGSGNGTSNGSAGGAATATAF